MYKDMSLTAGQSANRITVPDSASGLPPRRPQMQAHAVTAPPPARRPQMRLSTEDLTMMVTEVSGSLGRGVDMDAFLRIMEHSCWY